MAIQENAWAVLPRHCLPNDAMLCRQGRCHQATFKAGAEGRLRPLYDGRAQVED